MSEECSTLRSCIHSRSTCIETLSGIFSSVAVIVQQNIIHLYSAAKVLDFIQIAWIFPPDDLDLNFIHQSSDFSYYA